MSITRRTMLRASVGIIGGAAIATSVKSEPIQGDVYLALVKANDARVAGLISAAANADPRRGSIRRIAGDLEGLIAAFCAPESAHHKSQSLVAPMENASRVLLAAQYPDGTIDSGNLQSPPDTGFVVEVLATALAVVKRNDSPQLAQVRENLQKFLLAAGEALSTGGVHTPNHRWVVSNALARTNAVLPNAKYVRRIDDWLGEGIDIDSDGQYCERSAGIYSRVSNFGLLGVARLLNRPALFDPVRRNLEMTIFYTHPDGEIETVGSRRQDQFMTRSVSGYYLEYRYMAIKDGNRRFAAMTRMIEDMGIEKAGLAGALIHFLEDPTLREKLPESDPLPTDYAKFFRVTSLARIRRGNVSATVYGGSDWPMGVASGLASNPTFFNFRKGEAILESVRMGASFFSKGFFRSAGLLANVDGNQYELSQRLEVPYYQPLSAADRNARGDYPLTPAEDRFWSKLNFPKRKMSEIKTLEQNVRIIEKSGAFELEFSILGPKGVPVTIELSFRKGGKLEGVRAAQAEGYFIDGPLARYKVGADTIEVGPGRADHERFSMEGASYSAHRGNLKTGGECVYITGYTPYKEKLIVR
jgi:hypothetical protein